MILAIFIYLGASTGLIVAQPAVINTLAVGTVVTEWGAYYKGVNDGSEK